MLLVACDREPYARPERMLVGFATVKPLAKEDLEEVHALDATISDAAVLVPLAAVVGRRGGAANDQRSMAVFRIDANGRAVEVAIEGHVLRHNDVVVTRGLDAGAKIVVEGAGSLYDNAPVSARPAWTLRGSATD